VSDEGRILALVGATATGKTGLGEEIAERLGAEIVCADSRQVFADLDLGTGKPTVAERRARPHHLFDSLPLDRRPSAGWFAREAAAAIRDIHGRGATPLLVGGAGLYVNALRQGLAPEPELDPAARERLRAEHAALPIETLRAKLERLDPESAARIRAADRQRTSRALEVVELSGHTLGWWRAVPARAPVAGRWRVIQLEVAPAELGARIEARTRDMFAHGLREETEALRARGLEAALRRLRAVGYDEVLDWIVGRASRIEAEARTTLRTRQLAKRQRTWFRHQIESERLDGGEPAAALRAAALRIFGT